MRKKAPERLDPARVSRAPEWMALSENTARKILTLVLLVVGFLMLRNSFIMLAGLYKSQAGWPENAWLQILDRGVYALVMPGAGFLLFSIICARVFYPDLAGSAAFKPVWLREDRSWVQALGVGFGTGLGLILLLNILVTFTPMGGNSASVPDNSSLAFQIKAAGMGTWFLLLTTGLLTPLLEEFFYRGVLQQFLKGGGWMVPVQVGLQALLFGLAHSVQAAPFLIFFGLLAGILYWRFGLVSSILAHVMYNSAILMQFRLSDI